VLDGNRSGQGNNKYRFSDMCERQSCGNKLFVTLRYAVGRYPYASGQKLAGKTTAGARISGAVQLRQL
jgi:hypothetical protein